MTRRSRPFGTLPPLSVWAIALILLLSTRSAASESVVRWTRLEITSAESPILAVVNDHPQAAQTYSLYFPFVAHQARPPTQVTILHTNDLHGNLQSDYAGRGGSAYAAAQISQIRAEVGQGNVALLDAGDAYLAAPPISELLLGESTIDIYNLIGYDVATFGNHEFDKGQTVLISRTMQSDFPWIGANIILAGSDWAHPLWCAPYAVVAVGGINLGIIGLATDETPQVTLKGTTAGLEFRDLSEAVLHYYDEVMAQADAVIVLAHMGTEDSGAFKGLKTVAQELIDAGKPIGLIIGGHQHQALSTPVMVGDTAIVSAGHSGRYVGQLTVTIDPRRKSLTVDRYELHTISNTLTANPNVEARVAYWADIVSPLVERPVGTTNVDLVRNYIGESNMGNLVTDSMLWKADQYDDGEVNGSVDIALTNPGGLRADIQIPAGTDPPYTMTWGDTFNVLPFGNSLFYMDLTGAQIQALLDQAATLDKGILQSAGLTWYWYNDCDCSEPSTWGAYGAMLNGEPLDHETVYRVVTNNFLAGGQDGWVTFAEGTNRWDSYFDMREALNEYVQWYNGAVGSIDYAVEQRITKLDKLITVLHTNDTHGSWSAAEEAGAPNGMVLLASAIAAERARNPNTLLVDSGDTFQGNAFSHVFRNDVPNPIAGGMNLLGYDAMVPGNHEFNFGRETFASMLGQLDCAIVGTANLEDDGSYGFINENLHDYVTMDVDGVKVAIFGLANPRVVQYELPTNIPGLTFHPAVESAQSIVAQILANEEPDLLLGLTHLGYYPGSEDVANDALVAESVAGIDVIASAHTHGPLDPAVMVTSTVNPKGTLIAHSGAHAQYLGKVNVGLVANDDGGFDIVLREGYVLPAADYNPQPDLAAYLLPFEGRLFNFVFRQVGQTAVPLDGGDAYSAETNAANLQCDAPVWELAQHGIEVDFHLAGAATNSSVAQGATPANPVTLTVWDLVTLIPEPKALVVMRMNGPQLKTVLERAYRNYYYNKYVEDHGGYDYGTECMLGISAGGVITYTDTYPELPSGDNVAGLSISGQEVDFLDADTFYNVSTINYLALNKCNFYQDGVTLWPIGQITHDTQYFHLEAVYNYIEAMGTISPAIEGRLQFVQP